MPPYNYLFGAKYISTLPFCDYVQEKFKERYNDQLLAVVSTSATGLHCPIYNRISLKKIRPMHLFQEGERLLLYERIGETSEYSTAILSKETANKAGILMNQFGVDEINKPENKSPYSKQRNLYKSLDICGISKEVLMLNKKGVYLGTITNNSLPYLKQGTNPENFTENEIAFNTLTTFFTNELIPRALRQDIRMQKLAEFAHLDIQFI